jgi:enolase
MKLNAPPAYHQGENRLCRIDQIHAREVFDSRGRPTVEVEVGCVGSQPQRVIVPSGASTGRFEAVELRDGDAERLEGAGVSQAVGHVCGEIASALIGSNADDQAEIDRRLCELDGTQDKSRLGANAILGVSLGVAHAAASALGRSPVEHFAQLWQRVSGRSRASSSSVNTAALGTALLLPMPMVNMISGGLHAGGNLDFQDYLAIPVGATSYREALEWVVSIYRNLGRLLADAGHEGFLVGDEGGYGPQLASNREAVDFLMQAIESAQLRPGEDVGIGLDVAATHFFENGRYHLKSERGRLLTSNDVVDTMESWIEVYPIISIEDPLAEEDWDGWLKMTERLGNRVQLIGDDLFVTNQNRLQRGIESKAANSILIKPNQIGTLWETLQTLGLALEHDYWPVISARSGETEDTTIADLAVATGAGQIKIGSVVRSERLAKYNQLLRLEEQLGDQAGYLGGAIFRNLTT